MTHGFDTSFLVAAEVAGHADHAMARARLDVLRRAGDRFALAPQVLAEFVHVVTDSKRFSQPLTMADSLDRAKAWWNSPEVEQTSPDDDSVQLFLKWMAEHRLGRKRVLDTLLAATYYNMGVVSLLTTNARDFSAFGVFTCVGPGLNEAAN